MSFPQRHPLCGPGASDDVRLRARSRSARGAGVAHRSRAVDAACARHDEHRLRRHRARCEPCRRAAAAARRAAAVIEVDAEASLPRLIEEVRRQMTPDRQRVIQDRASEARRRQPAGASRGADACARTEARRVECQSDQHRADLRRAVAAHRERRLDSRLAEQLLGRRTTPSCGITTNRTATWAAQGAGGHGVRRAGVGGRRAGREEPRADRDQHPERRRSELRAGRAVDRAHHQLPHA